MKNPMTLKEQHQALDDNADLIPMQWRCFNNHETLWRDRSLGAAGKPLNFYSNEYRRKPEPLVKFTTITATGLHVTRDSYEHARLVIDEYGGGVIHRLVEDTDWVEPEPEEKVCPRCSSPSPEKHPAVQLGGEVQMCSHPFHKQYKDPNPWRPIIEGEWPEGGPMSKIEIRHENGRVVACFASDFRCDLTNATHWRYAEDE